MLDDGWTVVTTDGTWAAHFEHTVAITADGPWVLTAADGGASGLASGRRRPARRRPGRPGARDGHDPRIRASDDDRDRTASCCASTTRPGGWTPTSSTSGWTRRSRPRPSASSTPCCPTCPASTCTGCPTTACPGGPPCPGPADARRDGGGRGRPAPWPVLARLAGGLGLLAQRVGRADRDLDAERDGLPVVAWIVGPWGAVMAGPLGHRQPPRRRAAPGRRIGPATTSCPGTGSRHQGDGSRAVTGTAPGISAPPSPVTTIASGDGGRPPGSHSSRV